MLIRELPENTVPEGPLELVMLSWHERCRARARRQTDRGTEIMLSLPRGTTLFDGTVLHNSPDRTIVVKASLENVLVIAPKSQQESLTVAHHLGNWHRSVELAADGKIVAEADGPLETWLQHSKIEYQALRRPFHPDLRCAGHD